MIVLISPEQDIPNEMKILHQLFDAGLEFYHLRKPNKTKEEYRAYIEEIDVSFHGKVVVHQHHELVNEFTLKGIHFQEQSRKDNIDNPNKYFVNLEMYGKTISSSFHEPQDIANCHFEFDYHLLSPVFNAISKAGYAGRGFDVNGIDKYIIGMGGVTASNSKEVKALGYSGIGVLGGVWQAENPIAAFEELKEKYLKYFIR